MDGSMELGELHRTIHGRTAEREVASGEMYRKTRKHGSDAMSQNVRSGSPRAGPSPPRTPRPPRAPGCRLTRSLRAHAGGGHFSRRPPWCALLAGAQRPHGSTASQRGPRRRLFVKEAGGYHTDSACRSPSVLPCDESAGGWLGSVVLARVLAARHPSARA